MCWRCRDCAALRAKLDGALALDADGSRFELVSPAGRAEIRLPFPGRHNVLNALAATAMALAAEAF